MVRRGVAVARGAGMTTTTKDEKQALAMRYLEAGISIVPIQPGTKNPYFDLLPRDEKQKAIWEPYKSRLATEKEISKWFQQECGIGIIGGAVSGGLLIIDFESIEAFEQWQSYALMVVDATILQSMPIVETGKGRHVYLRCEEPGKNRKLATQGKNTLIETRGEGGYVLAPPTIHPSGKTYTTIHGDLTNIPHIPMEYVHALLGAARAVSPPVFPLSGKPTQNGNGNGNVIDTFNATYTLEDILTQHGYTRAGINRLVRPGGEKSSVILSEGRSIHFNSNDLLYREAPGGGYYSHDAFSAWCCLEHGDDVKAAVKAAAKMLNLTTTTTPQRTENNPLEINNQRYILPPGYDFDNGILYHLGKLLYIGNIYVPETGINMHSGEQTALIKWQGGGTAGEVVALHSDIASQGGITKVLGGAGAAVHAYNAKHMSRFLVEFIQVNRQTIPHVKHSEYYGNIEDGMILPAGNIITKTRYIGSPIQVGKDRAIYTETLRAIQEWAPPILWAVLAFGLASPFYGRLKVDRNPILHLGGSSGAGKTTIAHFATGAYGDPRVTPLQTQCGSGTTTPKGMSTALLQANGLPVFFDDIHKMLERKKQDTEGIMYDFAHAQNRTWGTVGNRATGGGQELHGTLITGGETSLSFLNAGSNNRVFSFDCSMPDQYPLGCQARSSLGMQRARQLQAAWGAGAGTLGFALAQTALRDWQLFKTDIRAFELDSHLEPLQAWRRLLAVAAATLQAVSILADLELDIDRLMRVWCDTLQDNNHSHDPAEEAFERVKVLFIQGQQHFDATTGWHRIEYDRKLIAVRRENQNFWRCMHTTPDFTTVVGVNAVEMFGSTWLKHGWLLPHKNGKIINTSWMGNGSPRCILVNNFLHDGEEDEQ